MSLGFLSGEGGTVRFHRAVVMGISAPRSCGHMTGGHSLLFPSVIGRHGLPLCPSRSLPIVARVN